MSKDILFEKFLDKLEDNDVNYVYDANKNLLYGGTYIIHSKNNKTYEFTPDCSRVYVVNDMNDEYEFLNFTWAVQEVLDSYNIDAGDMY